MATFYILRSEEDLAHHGIKGMKWGIRRYQNEDGTLTDSGKRRYLNKITKMSGKYEKLSAKSQKATAKANKYLTRGRVDNEKAAKMLTKVNDRQKKAARQLQKALKWYNKTTKKMSAQTLSDPEFKSFSQIGEKLMTEKRFMDQLATQSSMTMYYQLQLSKKK